MRQLKNHSTLFALLIAFPILLGCGSWAGRMFVRSLSRLNSTIEPAPRTITTPLLTGPGLAVAWSGHATVLFQIHDKVFVTDPFFSNAVAMVVRRYVAPGLDPDSLTSVDATLISHIHFDHFSYGSLDRLPKNGALFVPEGALPYTPEFGFASLHELSAWESVEHEGVRITAVPVQHFSGRYGIDGAWMRNIGYTGYIVEYEGICVFYGGDTGYDPATFKEIGRKYSIDLAIIPIGPGSSREIGGRIHVHPGGAMTIFRELRARYLLPMHHSTMYYGSDDDPRASITTIRQLAAESGISDRLLDLEVGEQRIVFRGRPLPAGGQE